MDDVCTYCTHKRAGYFTVGRFSDPDESIKIGKKLMKKRAIPERSIVVMNPNPAEDLEIRLDKMWDKSGREPLFRYKVAKVPLVLVDAGVPRKPTESVPVLVIEESTFGFFNLQWLDHALNLKPKMRIVSANFLARNELSYLEIFVEYVDNPPKYTVRPMRRKQVFRKGHETLEFAKCSYCRTVYYVKTQDDGSGPNCPMCGDPTAYIATKEDIKKAKFAECLRDEEGSHITDEILDALGINPDSIGKD